MQNFWIFFDLPTQWTSLGLALSQEEQIWCPHNNLIWLSSVLVIFGILGSGFMDPCMARVHAREILDKYVDLEKSYLSDSEKNQVMDVLYKCKDTFSLRDGIGACLNIEVEIDVTDKLPFFIRPYHVKEENKNILGKEMKRLGYLGILKEGFSAYLNSVLLISGKVTKIREL